MGAPQDFHNDQVPFLAAVADGLGGHSRGDLASAIALIRLCALVGNEESQTTAGSLAATLSTIHTELLELSASSVGFRGMGTTIAGLHVQRDEVLVFNAGDSRVYRKEGGFLQLLSVDDRLTGEKRFGECDAEESSGVLLQCLGGPGAAAPLSPHVSTVAIGLEETFLVCTDGVHNVLSLDEIEAAMSSNHYDWLVALVEKALTAGAPDNLSVLAIRISGRPT
jgi:protein phosphatase